MSANVSQYLLPLIFLIVSLPLSAYSQWSNAETYKILGISVEGNNPESGTEASAIITNSGLRMGDQITIPSEQTRQVIQRLWVLRIFSDVQLLVENKVSDGVYLLIKVKEYPRLERVEIEGEDDVDEDDIMKKVPLVKGQILSPEDISKAVRNIKQLYEEEGHLLATVIPETLTAEVGKSNHKILRLKIDEGPSVGIDKVRVVGSTAFSEDDLKDEMEDTGEKTWWHFWSNPKFDKKKYEKDKQRIVQFYRKHGYLDAEILSDSTWYSEDRKKISVLINVRDGAQYKIRNITWEGNTVYRDDVLTERLQFYPGDTFDQERFEQNLRGNQDQSDVTSLYRDNGYLAFNIDPEIKRAGNDSLDIINHIYERHQFRIGHVEIKGNTKTQDNIIRRELYTLPGESFNQSKIIRSIRQLAQLNYFNPEKLNKFPEIRPVDEKTVDITYEVEEKSSDNVNASIGYSGAFGVTGALGFTINNFSISDPLSGGAGQIFNFEWQFGEGARFRTFSLSFTEPWLYNTPTTLGISLFDTRQIFVYDLRQTGLSIRIGRGRIRWLDDYFRLDWVFRFQNNNVIDNGGNPLYDIGKSTQYSISQTISRNSTDSPIFPSTGSAFSLTTELAGGPLLPGNVDFHKWLFNVDWYTPLFGTNRLVLYTSSSAGYLNGFEDDSKIPPIEYFYMGGTGIGYIATTPLRGYEDRSIGPKDEFGRELGGNVFTKHTAELRLALTLNPIPIYFLGFLEGGNVFSDFKHTDFFDLKRSYGFGARLLIQPLGMIGFDYGYGVDDVTGAQGLPDGQPDGWHFHFQFGRGF
ncbi:MAG: outer membrane protein assembly factor BamA [Ignavibacteriae bacterium]|nr:outer membrane protein assembly factor BamA [Ignavibacteriota bacterium]